MLEWKKSISLRIDTNLFSPTDRMTIDIWWNGMMEWLIWNAHFVPISTVAACFYFLDWLLVNKNKQKKKGLPDKYLLKNIEVKKEDKTKTVLKGNCGYMYTRACEILRRKWWFILVLAVSNHTDFLHHDNSCEMLVLLYILLW